MISIILVSITFLTGTFWLAYLIRKYLSKNNNSGSEPKLVTNARDLFLIFLMITLIKAGDVGILPLLMTLIMVSFLIRLIDRIFFYRARLVSHKKEPIFVDYARSFLPILLIVFLIRAFVVQIFTVPTGSLEPTIMPHDLVIVDQFSYGLRLPVFNKTLVEIGKPKTGDIVVFRHPAVPGMDLIKRTIGVPGDHVIYKNKTLYINGKEMRQSYLDNAVDGSIPVEVFEENLLGIKHKIYLHTQGGEITNFDFTVPEGYYFMMGDNRDNSADSRMWGFMPDSVIIGKGYRVVFAWNQGVTWNRIGQKL